MSEFQLQLVPGGSSIMVDGEEVAQLVQSLHLTQDAGGVPVLTLEYPCFEAVDADGLTKVVHYCPLREDES